MTDKTKLMTDRRGFLVGSATLAAFWGLGLKAHAQLTPTAKSFLVVGDWGRDGTSHQQDVANAMGKVAAEKKASFVASVGDNFYDNGVTSVTDPQWKTSFEDVYKAPSLQVPWYVALGNHDYRGNAKAQIDYSKTSTRWRMPSRYFALTADKTGLSGVDIFVIDTTPLVDSYRTGTKRPALEAVWAEAPESLQLNWLEAALAASKAKMKIVLGHHTLYSGGKHGDTPEMQAKILPILKRQGVKAYICGHDHDLQHIERDGIAYILTGAGSETREVKAIEGTKFAVARSGFTAYDLVKEGLKVSYIDYEAKVLFEAVVRA